MNFLSTVKNFDDVAASGGEDLDMHKIEGKMFTETSLFRIIKQLDLLSTLSDESEDSYQIVQRFSNPHNLRNIIELTVEASPQNQIIVLRILQQILKLDLPQEILD